MTCRRRKPCRTFAALVLAALATSLATAQAEPAAGADAAVRKAIDDGLGWLVRNQAADGSWSNSGGYGSYPVAMTGLAGMALLSSGSTPTRGPHWRQVRGAVDYLLKRASADNGYIALGPNEHHGMYGHGFATLFLASVYGMEEDLRKQQQLRRALHRAVDLISASQSAAGGWYYTPESNTDEGSVTVTQIQALRACRMAGIVVDKKTIDRAVDYVRRCQNEDGGIAYRLSMVGGTSQPAISAAAVAVLYNAGVYDDQPFVDRAVRFCKQRLRVATDTTGHHYYAQFYWAQALYQRGGRDWDDYFQRACAWLLGQRRKDGSWMGDGVGTVYGTATALIMLQLPQSLVPIYQR